MVATLGPGRFYGRSLPRPRYYTDIKYSDERIDPPVPVLDPLLSWANEAHWSMGGLSFTRFILQGRIEGNVKKLRAEQEELFKKRSRKSTEADNNIDDFDKKVPSVSPHPAPIVNKRRRFMSVIEDEEDEDEIQVAVIEMGKGRRKLARKLGDDFDRVTSKSEMPLKKGSIESGTVPLKTRSRRSEEDGSIDEVMKVVDEVNGLISKGKMDGEASPSPNRTRTSPRLTKNRPC